MQTANMDTIRNKEEDRDGQKNIKKNYKAASCLAGAAMQIYSQRGALRLLSNGPGCKEQLY